MFVKNHKLAFASLTSFQIMVVGGILAQMRAHKDWQLFCKKCSNLNAFIHENISGMKMVQNFATEKETQQESDELLTEHRDSFVSAVRFADAFDPVVDICWSIAFSCLLFVGVKLAQRGKI